MWTQGEIDGFKYCVKHYDEPSESYGIDGGRISKLLIRKHGETEDLVAYDYPNIN
jgi:hypothetical protein